MGTLVSDAFFGGKSYAKMPSVEVQDVAKNKKEEGSDKSSSMSESDIDLDE